MTDAPMKQYRDRIYRVATYYDPAAKRASNRVTAYLRDYHSSWPGFRLYEVWAATGSGAKMAAIEMRKRDEGIATFGEEG